ncbi:hypothetical protein BDR03DRAFT_954670 [Suillus americanus]|nr:hypothetical protein BDR03DRAFT_954670 [Suillus americanus]
MSSLVKKHLMNSNSVKVPVGVRECRVRKMTSLTRRGRVASRADLVDEDAGDDVAQVLA